MLQGRPPKLVHYDGEIILRNPENFDDLDAQEKSRIRECIGKSMLFYIHQLRIKNMCPILLEVFGYPYGETRTDPISIMGNTWDNDIIRLRGGLIMLERYWESMGFDIPCPIHLKEEEIHDCIEEEGEIWNSIQNFWGQGCQSGGQGEHYIS
ncbi:hypothetical protein BO85DRAFT_261190 [Aspergillus piperis CBS 112811]|uniref:Uncharacterized protein n=1 Tax=Aspergillus piperis CBS 112811 TaxID=1448313 RepID=A0A8G1VMR1_9EURO|nr:hypothetical protein BO85DRAFT_261190 [Aspergillus piperis CBS 112811]RAH59119.1 hypothetical protein BO85DRAFT_261190 [Aspergillus piperis CBS 112811]